ncbi:MAG: hypothetical protein MJ217_02315 [Bacilli bacterium]|nr:hypothetical protein [Bacilli bacterium]
MKIYPNRVRITLYFLIAVLILGVVIYLALLNWFISPWGPGQIIVTAAYVLMSVTLFIINIKSTFYVLNSSYLSFFRWGKETRFFYKDIIYIDQRKGNLTPTIEMYTSVQKYVYLTTDSGTKLYDCLLSKCKNLLTYEEFNAKFNQKKK